MKRAFLSAVLVLTGSTFSFAQDLLESPFPGASRPPVDLLGLRRIEAVVQPHVEQDDLPPAASALLKSFDQEADQIRERINAEIAAKREVLIQQLQAMQDGYTREAKLDEAVAIRDSIRKLRRAGLTVIPYPIANGGYGSWGLTSYRGQIGKVLHFEVTGSNTGSIYGSDIYTDDSDLATAAVHAGLLKVGQKGVVKVTILEGQASHASTTRNGITSSAWASYGGSYKVEAIPGGARSATVSSKTLADPGSLWGYEKRVGETIEFQVTGSTSSGSIWGTGTYTGDSRLAVAAVHAGVLRDGETGIVKVTILPGDSRYLGSTRNGISSYDYGAYSFSYRIDPTGSPSVGPRLFLGAGSGFRLQIPALGDSATPSIKVTPQGSIFVIEESSESNSPPPRVRSVPATPSSDQPPGGSPR